MNKRRVIYRNANLGDIDSLAVLEERVWGHMAACKDKWRSRINIFPDGVWIAENGSIIGVLAANIIQWNENCGFPTWEEASGDGYIKNYDINGNVLYGIDLTVEEKIGQNVAVRLLEFPTNMAKESKQFKGMTGARIPSLCKKIKKEDLSKMSNEDILSLAKKDPTVNFFLQHGYKIIGIKKDYFSVDEESFGYGAMLEVIK